MNSEELKKMMDADEKTWFTLQNLSSITQQPYHEIQGAIKNSDLFVRSSIPDNSGNALYATKKDYEEKGSFFNKVIGAFKNRID